VGGSPGMTPARRLVVSPSGGHPRAMDFRLGSRTSALAQHHVASLISAVVTRIPREKDSLQLRAVELASLSDEVVPVRGAAKPDPVVAAVRTALVTGEVDAIVHLMVDLPHEKPQDIDLVAVIPQAEPRLALVSPHGSLEELSVKSRVATRTLAECAQVRFLRPDLTVTVVRGSLAGRLRAVREGEWDALVAPYAHVEALGRSADVRQVFSVEDMVPTPGGECLAIEMWKEAAEDSRVLMNALDDQEARACAQAERTVVRMLREHPGAAIAARAQVEGDYLSLHVRATSADGSLQLNDFSRGYAREAEALGATAAHALLGRGVSTFAHPFPE